MKNKLIFTVAVLATWYITINLPIWRLENQYLEGLEDTGFTCEDTFTFGTDNYHLLFMYLSGPLLALVSLVNPNKLLLVTFGLYIIILALGFLGFAFSEFVALKWGWYVHLVSMIVVVAILGQKLFPEAFKKTS
jgi:hypothetical protein